MKEERYHLALDVYDKNIVIRALNTLRTQQLQEERPTDPVDELIIKVSEAPSRKVRVLPCKCRVVCPLDRPVCRWRSGGNY